MGDVLKDVYGIREPRKAETPEEARANIIALLHSPGSQNLSNRDLATISGTSPATVAKVKKELQRKRVK